MRAKSIVELIKEYPETPANDEVIAEMQETDRLASEVLEPEEVEGRPPKKDWSRWISCGVYVGLTVSHDIDWEKIAKDLYDSKFNAITLHLISPWANEGGIFYPWPYDSAKGKFDLTKDNEEWYTAFETMCFKLAYYWIGVELKFFDSYFSDQWIKYGIKIHPFRNNKLKNLVSKQDAKWFYDVWVPYEFLWYKWEDVNNYEFKNFQTVSPLGEHLDRYVKRVMSIVQKVKEKHPGFRVRSATFNETHAYVGVDGEGDADRSMGDRQEIQYWMRELWKEYIKPPMSHVISYTDYDIVGAGADKYRAQYLAKATRTWFPRFRTRLEVHGMDSSKDVQELLKAGVTKISEFSSDGSPEEPEKNYGKGDSPYFKRMKTIEALYLPVVDYKLWARYKGERKWRDGKGSMMWNWNEFFPLMEQIFT